MATHSSILVWRIPWREEPGGLQSIGLQRVEHDWRDQHMHTFSLFGFRGGSVVKNLPTNAGEVSSNPGSGRSPGGGNGNPFQYSCLENSMDRGAYSPDRLQSIGLQRVRHDWACTPACCLLHPLASLYLSTRNTGNLGVFISFQFPVHFHSHRFPRSLISLQMKQ